MKATWYFTKVYTLMIVNCRVLFWYMGSLQYLKIYWASCGRGRRTWGLLGGHLLCQWHLVSSWAGGGKKKSQRKCPQWVSLTQRLTSGISFYSFTSLLGTLTLQNIWLCLSSMVTGLFHYYGPLLFFFFFCEKELCISSAQNKVDS